MMAEETATEVFEVKPDLPVDGSKQPSGTCTYSKVAKQYVQCLLSNIYIRSAYQLLKVCSSLQ